MLIRVFVVIEAVLIANDKMVLNKMPDSNLGESNSLLTSIEAGSNPAPAAKL